MAIPEGVDLYVNEDGILEPLDLFVRSDSRLDLLPRAKDVTETIPGRHGEIYLNSKLHPRLIELRVALSEETTPEQREQLKREMARHLNPTKGHKVLAFADEPEKQYFVKYSGSIDVTQYASWFEFTIPFKCSDPYIYSKEKSEEVYTEQSPGAVELESNGNMVSLPKIIVENNGDPGQVVNGFIIRHYVEID